MATFKELLIEEYPIPLVASIYGTTLPVETRANLDTLIELALKECESDLELYDSVEATGLATQLPLTAKAVSSVRFATQFQGNRYVKWTFDYASKVVTLRYYPATIKYKRSVELADLENLKGSRLNYIKSFIMVKMLNKEISYLTAVKLDPEAGSIDVQALLTARDRYQTNLDLYRDDIAILSNG